MNDSDTTRQYTPRTNDYWAKLPEFEGPLDILLHFVKEDELNIYDIPISKITKDYLGYLQYIQSLDIEVAGEFLLMATELMKIKARMLIPIDETEVSSEDWNQPLCWSLPSRYISQGEPRNSSSRASSTAE